MCKENQVNKELTGQMKHLRAEQASLQSAGSQLESEIQKLQPKLQIHPELHEECIMQRCRKSTKKENRGIEEKLGNRGETSQRVLEYQPCPSPGRCRRPGGARVLLLSTEASVSREKGASAGCLAAWGLRGTPES